MDVASIAMEFKSKTRMRIAIIGGGIAGLACAKVLLERGAGVSVFDAQTAGHGALWASGGMLAGGFECAESGASPAFASLAHRGMTLWSDWARELGKADIGYRQGGVVSPAMSESDFDWLDAMAARAERLDIACRRDIEIPEGLQARRAICFPNDGELDNRLLGPRLVAFIREAGGIFHEYRPVSGFRSQDGGVHIGDRTYDAAIIATGAARNLTDAEPALNDILPVKGQMLSVEPRNHSLPFCLRAQNGYVSQKQDGRIVIGASSEPKKSDIIVDQAVIDEMFGRAQSWLPMLKGQNVTDSWAGVRPGTRDAMPMLGPGTQPGIFLALGLYRNGVLLAPAVAEMMADAMLSGRNVPAEFLADRFNQR